MLEIPLQEGSYNFPLLEISNKRYILSSIDYYMKLQESISKWVNQYQNQTHEEYENYVIQRLSQNQPTTLITHPTSKSSTERPISGNSRSNYKSFDSTNAVMQPKNSDKNFYKHSTNNQNQLSINNAQENFKSSTTRKKSKPKNIFYDYGLVEAIEKIKKQDRKGQTPTKLRSQIKNYLSLTQNPEIETNFNKHTISSKRKSLYGLNGHSKLDLHNLKTVNKKNDSLYKADKHGRQEEWSIDKETVTNNWGLIHKEKVLQLAISHNGEILLTCDNLGSFKQWSTKTRRLIWDYGHCHKGWIGTLKITPNDQYAFTGGENGILKQWSLYHQKLWKDYSLKNTEHIYSQSISPDGNYFFSGSGETGNQKQWKIVDKLLCKDYLRVHSGKINDMVVSENSKWLFTVGEDGLIKQWNIKQQKLFRNYGRIHRDSISCIDITSDGKFLVTCTGNFGMMKLWRFRSYVSFFI